MVDWINQTLKNARLEVYMLHAGHNNSAEPMLHIHFDVLAMLIDWKYQLHKKILWKNRCNSVLHHNFYHNNCLRIAAMDIIIK